MAPEQTIEFALNSGNSMSALRALVESEYRNGIAKVEITHRLYLYSQRTDISETSQDQLYDVLDALCGYCSAHYRLIPEEPDVISFNPR